MRRGQIKLLVESGLDIAKRPVGIPYGAGKAIVAANLRPGRSPDRRSSGDRIIRLPADDGARLASRSSAGTDWEIIAWKAIANAGIAGSDLRDMMLEAVGKPFGAIRTPHPV